MIKVTFSDEDGVDTAEFKTTKEANEFISYNTERCEVSHSKPFIVISMEGSDE